MKISDAGKGYLPVDSCRKLRNSNRLPNQATSPSTKGVKVAIMTVRGEGRADGTPIPHAADRSSPRDRASALNRHCWLFDAAGTQAARSRTRTGPDCSKHGLLPERRSERKAGAGADWRRNGASIFSQSGRTGTLRFGDQSKAKRKLESAIKDGNSSGRR